MALYDEGDMEAEMSYRDHVRMPTIKEAKEKLDNVLRKQLDDNKTEIAKLHSDIGSMSYALEYWEQEANMWRERAEKGKEGFPSLPRIEELLESIALSLEKLSNPPTFISTTRYVRANEEKSR